jgi:hypothetical protein
LKTNESAALVNVEAVISIVISMGHNPFPQKELVFKVSK